MDSVQFDSVIDKLAPISILSPVTHKKIRKIRLDDTELDANNSPIYVNGRVQPPAYLNSASQTLHTTYSEGLKLLEKTNLSNVSNLAYWQASSNKIGNPITNVLTDDADNFWQSDGAQPHEIDIYFSGRVDIAMIALFFSLKTDESYTPKLVKISAGHSPSDAVFYKNLEIKDMNGWVGITFEDNRSQDRLLKCQFIRLTFPMNHENGKDTHLRGVRVYSPSVKTSVDDENWLRIVDPNSRLINDFSIR